MSKGKKVYFEAVDTGDGRYTVDFSQPVGAVDPIAWRARARFASKPVVLEIVTNFPGTLLGSYEHRLVIRSADGWVAHVEALRDSDIGILLRTIEALREAALEQ